MRLHVRRSGEGSPSIVFVHGLGMSGATWQAVVDVLAPGTIRHRLSCLRTFCAWAVRAGHLKKDPTLDFKGPGRTTAMPRELSDDEIAKIARWADTGAPEGDKADLPPAP